MRNIEKSHIYQMKSLNGDIEELDSRERVISEDQYKKKLKSEGSFGKYERVGFRVERDGAAKTIDSTQDYAAIMEAIDKLYTAD